MTVEPGPDDCIHIDVDTMRYQIDQLISEINKANMDLDDFDDMDELAVTDTYFSRDKYLMELADKVAVIEHRTDELSGYLTNRSNDISTVRDTCNRLGIV